MLSDFPCPAMFVAALLAAMFVAALLTAVFVGSSRDEEDGSFILELVARRRDCIFDGRSAYCRFHDAAPATDQ